MSFIKKTGCVVYRLFNGIGRDIALLLVRISMIHIFFQSGMLKFNDWENTLFLFELEYIVPLIPYELAAYLATIFETEFAVPSIPYVLVAYLATFFELLMPMLIVAGVFTRLACLPLFAMTLVIQFILGGSDPAYNQLGHYHWMLLLGVLMCFGAGRFSIDWVLCKVFCRGGDKQEEVSEE